MIFFAKRHRPDLTPFLSVDRDGSPILALAGRKRFSIVHLRAKSHGVIAGRIRTERGNLVRAPIVDQFGYSFVVAAADGALRIKHRDILRPVACSDDDVDENDSCPPFSNPPRCEDQLLENLF